MFCMTERFEFHQKLINIWGDLIQLWMKISGSYLKYKGGFGETCKDGQIESSDFG